MSEISEGVKELKFTGKLVRTPLFYKQWMIAGNPAHFFDRLIRDFGDFVHYRGLFNFYLVNHPSLVKQVLIETHQSFDKNTIIVTLQPSEVGLVLISLILYLLLYGEYKIDRESGFG